MTVRGMVVALAGAVALAVPATALGDALIGNFTDGNLQGVDSNQSGINGSGGGEFSGPGPVKFIDGASKPNLTQLSTNVASNDALVGGGGGDGTMIGNGSQQNKQAINSNQVAKKGKQTSVNVESGTQIIGLAAGDAIIGDTGQASDQGTNSLQTASSRPGSGVLFVEDTNKAPLTQDSMNLLISCEMVIGGAAGTC